jgi:hypothetical protein
MARSAVIATCVVGVLVVAVLVVRYRPPAHDSVDEAPAANVAAAPVHETEAPTPPVAADVAEPDATAPSGNPAMIMGENQQTAEANAATAAAPTDPFATLLGENPKVDRRTPRELQAALRSEPRDEMWAPHTENTLNDYLTTQPYMSFYDSVSVLCGQTLCRVQATGDEAVLASIPGAEHALAHWQQSVLGGRHDSAWQNLSHLSSSFGSDPNQRGRVLIVTFLGRDDK